MSEIRLTYYPQGHPMFTNTRKSRRPITMEIVMVASLALFVTACGPGKPEVPDAVNQAGRDNVNAMSGEHADDTTEASEAAKIAPRRPIISERLAYAEVENELVHGYFAFPAEMV